MNEEPLIAALYEIQRDGKLVLLGEHPVVVQRRRPGLMAASVSQSCGFGAEETPERYWLIKRGPDVLEVRRVVGYRLGARPTNAGTGDLRAWQYEQIAVWAWNAADWDWERRFGVTRPDEESMQDSPERPDKTECSHERVRFGPGSAKYDIECVICGELLGSYISVEAAKKQLEYAKLQLIDSERFEAWQKAHPGVEPESR